VLELNPSHPLLKRLLERFETERDSEEFAKQAELLYDLALVAEGSQPRDPHAFTLTLASRLAE